MFISYLCTRNKWQYEEEKRNRQVSYDISAEKTRKREVNGLLMAAKATGCENLLLLTDHESEVIEQDGHKVKVQPVYEWCGEIGV